MDDKNPDEERKEAPPTPEGRVLLAAVTSARDKPVTLPEMIEFVTAEAAHTELIEAVALREAWRLEPDAKNIRRLAILNNIEKTLTLFEQNRDAVIAVLRNKRRG